jgi:hypothetical protein
MAFTSRIFVGSVSVIWRYYIGGEMLENVPAIYGNKVYVHTNNGWLVAIQ